MSAETLISFSSSSAMDLAHQLEHPYLSSLEIDVRSDTQGR